MRRWTSTRPGLLDGLEGEERAGARAAARAPGRRRVLPERSSGHGGRGGPAGAAAGRARARRHLHRRARSRSAPGCPPATMLRIRRLLGLPEPARRGPRVLRRGRRGRQVDEAVPRRRLRRGARSPRSPGCWARAWRRLAATIAAAFVETFLEPGDERGRGRAALRRAGRAADARRSRRSWWPAFNAHLRDSVRRGMLGRAELEAGDIAGAQELAVCFADLVGFTRLGGRGRGRRARHASPAGWPSWPTDVDRAPGPPGQDDRRRRDVRQPRARRRSWRSRCSSSRPSRPRICPACGPASPSGRRCSAPATTTATRSTWPAGSPASPGPAACSAREEVRDAARDAFDWSSAGRHKLKGVSGPDAAVPGPARARRGAGADAKR